MIIIINIIIIVMIIISSSNSISIVQTLIGEESKLPARPHGTIQ